MKGRGWVVLLVAALYIIVGLCTAALSRGAATPGAVRLWRFLAWGGGLVIVVGHIIYDRAHWTSGRSRTALRAAAAVAIAVVVLAIVGPVLAHRNSADFWKSAVLSVVLWPILAGIPAFLVSLGLASVVDRVRRG